MVGLASSALLWWVVRVYPTSAAAGRGHREVSVTLDAHTTLFGLSRTLERAHVVRHPLAWALYARIKGAHRRLRTGVVLIHDGLQPIEILRQVAKGFGRRRLRVTLPEGYTRFDIATRLGDLGICSAQDFLVATEDSRAAHLDEPRAHSVEGYLFPDTYEFFENTSAAQVVTRMVSNFRARVLPLVTKNASGLAALQDDLGFSLHDVVTLASIVQKEAYSVEQPSVAGVFLNRLRKPGFRPRRLQADPTVIYGCISARVPSDACRTFDGKRITRQMLDDVGNPYNTYRIDALPPGPICNPGESAIRAVLRPDVHPYLYFVAKGRGRHHFSVGLAEHQQATARYRTRSAPSVP